MTSWPGGDFDARIDRTEGGWIIRIPLRREYLHVSPRSPHQPAGSSETAQTVHTAERTPASSAPISAAAAAATAAAAPPSGSAPSSAPQAAHDTLAPTALDQDPIR
jgi:hypothetical protein